MSVRYVQMDICVPRKLGSRLIRLKSYRSAILPAHQITDFVALACDNCVESVFIAQMKQVLSPNHAKTAHIKMKKERIHVNHATQNTFVGLHRRAPPVKVLTVRRVGIVNKMVFTMKSLVNRASIRTFCCLELVKHAPKASLVQALLITTLNPVNGAFTVIRASDMVHQIHVRWAKVAQLEPKKVMQENVKPASMLLSLAWTNVSSVPRAIRVQI